LRAAGARGRGGCVRYVPLCKASFTVAHCGEHTKSGNGSTVIPSIPGAPWFARTCSRARCRFSRPPIRARPRPLRGGRERLPHEVRFQARVSPVQTVVGSAVRLHGFRCGHGFCLVLPFGPSLRPHYRDFFATTAFADSCPKTGGRFRPPRRRLRKRSPPADLPVPGTADRCRTGLPR